MVARLGTIVAVTLSGFVAFASGNINGSQQPTSTATEKSAVKDTPTASAASLLPGLFTTLTAAHMQEREWSLSDLVGIRWINDVAVSQDGDLIAFLIKQSFLDPGDTRYGVYVAERSNPGTATKLVEASYISDLSTSPTSGGWTVLADFGIGIQLYEVDAAGDYRPLVVSPATARIGTWEGVIAGLGSPQNAGVLSYEWAPDGSAFWYSRLRLRSEREQQALAERGVVYDDRRMNAQTFRNYPELLEGTELRLVEISSGADRLLAFAPSFAATNLGLFRRDWGTAKWQADSRAIRYEVSSVTAGGQWEISQWRVDREAGRREAVPGAVTQMSSVTDSMTEPGYLALQQTHGSAQPYLVRMDLQGRISTNYGVVPFSAISAAYSQKPSSRGTTGHELIQVSYSDRDGLATIPESAAGKALAAVADNLSNCRFSRGGRVGACVRESLTLPPEVVLVAPDSGAVTTLVRPNEEYIEIAPLRSEPARWTNRYGFSSDGYVTYPRHYVAGKKYPAIVITHGTDARNRFVFEGFQWSFPLQLFAETGYFVLSVNEPRFSTISNEHLHLRQTPDTRQANAWNRQFKQALNAVASMEAATQALIAQGELDPSRIGIVGYSRGAEVALYAMTHSKVFKAGAIGDGSANAGSYWSLGSSFARAEYRLLYGGSPFDSRPTIRENYSKFSPSFRADKFSGPLLQLFPAANASFGFELNSLLQDARIPTEMVFFPDESHLFWNPSHRAAVMQRSLEWFNYWLLDRCELDLEARARHNQWKPAKQNCGTESRS